MLELMLMLNASSWGLVASRITFWALSAAAIAMGTTILPFMSRTKPAVMERYVLFTDVPRVSSALIALKSRSIKVRTTLVELVGLWMPPVRV